MKAPKQPAFQFYPGDWLKDPQLSKCEPATRGIWIDAIAAMHENCRSGTLSGTPGQLSRVLRCSEAAFMAALDDLQATGTADVTKCRTNVTLINRRMREVFKVREDSRLRQRRRRGREDVTPNVTSYSSSSSSKDPPTPMGLESLFLIWWEAYPLKIAKQDAVKAWAKIHPDQGLLDKMLAAIDVQSKSQKWMKDEGAFIPHPASWLNKRRWEDDLKAYKCADISEPVYEAPGSKPVFSLETGPDGKRIGVKAK